MCSSLCVKNRVKKQLIKGFKKIIVINYKRKKPFRGNGTASNDCLPYEKSSN
jgi:hypothetical protein